jgi:hypothetical protein
MNILSLILLFLFLSCPGITFSDETQSLDDVISGFEDNSSPTDIDTLSDQFDNESYQVNTVLSTTEKNAQTFDYSFLFKLSSVFNIAHHSPQEGRTDHRGLSRFRGESTIKFNLKFSNTWKAKICAQSAYDFSYDINGRDQYTKDVLNENESENELHETYIQGSLSPQLDLWFGRQIVAWGASETFRIVDVINPIDNREFGMVDIEDLRIPVVLTQLNYYVGKWKLSGILIHEHRKLKNPPYGNDYYLSDFPFPDEIVPANTLRNTRFAAALTGRFEGWDISFHAAQYDKHLLSPEITSTGNIQAKRIPLTMIGTTLAVAYGNWLIKSEIAGTYGHIFLNTPETKKYSMEGMLGFEYSGFKDTNISFEMMNQHIFDHSDRLLLSPDLIKEDTVQSAFRFSRFFLNEKLSLNLLLFLYGLSGKHGTLQRLSLEYDLNDDMNINIGSCLYQTGKSYIFKKIQDNDRVFLDIQYSF